MLLRPSIRWIHALAFIFAAALAASAQAPPPTVQTPDKGELEVYGFVMGDIGYSLKSNDPDWFDVMRPTKLPSFEGQFGRDGRVYAGARQTRFGVKGTQPTPWGDLKTQFEIDMFGVGKDAGLTTLRPRHYYGELGAFGAGQTHSPFMDVDVFPNIVEYWGPNGMTFFRNAQVRWMPIRGLSHLTLALEKPGSSQDPGRLEDRIEIQNVKPRYQYPDLSGDYRYGWNKGYVEVGGILRSIKLDDQLKDAVNLDDSIIGWGINLSSNLKFGKDVLRLEYVFGDGMENYMNDSPVDVAAEPNVGDPTRPIKGKALPMRSLVAFLDHTWSNKWASSVGYSEMDIDNTILQKADAFHRGQYAIANLTLSPVENVAYTGELQWGRRTNFADGFHANDYRLQFSFKYSFSGVIGGVK